MAGECVKTIPWAPFTGKLDTRSLPSEVRWGDWRWRQNVSVAGSGKPCRRQGFMRLLGELTPDAYQNADLHDQLLGQQSYYAELSPKSSDSDKVQSYPPPADQCSTSVQVRSGDRQPVTMLFEAVSTNGVRRLLAATQNRIYCSRFRKENWKLVADVYGGDAETGLSERRWQAAQTNDAVIFTNNFDPPLAWFFDQPNFGCAMQAVQQIGSLDDIGLTRCGTVYSWKGITFFGDVVMDGDRVPHRVVWSGLNTPLAFTPGNSSIAGFQDLAYGERILRFRELQDYLLIYTTRSIWQVSVIGGDAVFNFRQAYTQPETGEACLAFPNTLASTGDDHYYLGRDGIYSFNLFVPKPQRVEWMHLASLPIYDTIDLNFCEGHVACYHPPSKEYRVSWVEKTGDLPTRTMAFNVEYQNADLITHGFTAFCSHAPDLRPDIDIKVKEECWCSDADLAALAEFLAPSVKEGEPCGDVAASTCSTTTSPAYTSKLIYVDGKAVEDVWDTNPDGALCSVLNAAGFDKECKECSVDAKLVMASASDYCLKQDGGVYYHDVCTVFTTCGTYRQDGYTTILRSGPMAFRSPSELKELKMLEVEFYAEAQTVPSDLQLRIGISATASDSNSGGAGCGVQWTTLSSRKLKCPATGDGTTTAPAQTVNWPMWFQGRHLYFELKVEGAGGAACFGAAYFLVGGRSKCPEI